MEYYAGFILGMIGSMHCVGMCGPIALAVPHRRRSTSGLLYESYFYNFGRISTYSLLGMLLGLIGFGVQFVGLQQQFSIFVGIGILTFLLLRYVLKKQFNNSANQKINGFLKPYLQKFIKPKNDFQLFILGALNGLLPCGMVYVALAGATAFATPLNSAAFMALFGAGTLPVMTLIFLGKNKISLDLRQKIYNLVPYGIAFMGILFILRGSSLDIPYISPDIKKMYQPGEAANCELPGQNVAE